jgi:cytochrome P450
VSFGHGAHNTLGAALARIQLAEALRALVQQLPDLRLGRTPAEIVWTGNPLDDGPTKVSVDW